jgi:hypothetical protein
VLSLGAVALTAIVVVGATNGWRSGLLAALAAAAIVATRIRFAPQAACALLVVVALLALAGLSVGGR